MLTLMMDFPTPPKGHSHNRIHRNLFWPNRIDPDPNPPKEDKPLLEGFAEEVEEKRDEEAE